MNLYKDYLLDKYMKTNSSYVKLNQNQLDYICSGDCYHSYDDNNYEVHNDNTETMNKQDLDDYEILKYCKRIKTESYISIMREQRAFLDSLTDKQRQEFKDTIIQAHENNNL